MAKNTQTVGNMSNTAVAATVAAADEKKRNASKSLYVDGKGETSRSPTADTEIVRFVFDGFENSPVDLVINEISDAIAHLAICQGLNIKLQRSYNTAKGNAAQMRDECEATRDNLLNDVWTSEREGGLRIGDLADAIKATLTDEGESVDDERFARIKETLKDESKRDKAKASPKVQAHLTRIMAEKAAERAKVAGEAASKTETSGLTDF